MSDLNHFPNWEKGIKEFLSIGYYEGRKINQGILTTGQKKHYEGPKINHQLFSGNKK
jgi:hypothetical protein